LGELDEADRASVERLLESSAEARALVNELNVSASAIEDALISDSPDLLSAAQRAAVHNAADAGRARWFAHVQPLLRSRWSLGLGAAAAAVIVAAVVQMRPEPQTPTPSKDRGANVVTFAPGEPNAGSQRNDPQATSLTAQSPAASANPPAVAVAPTPRIEPPTTSNPGVAATTLTGSIRDASGAALPGVTVTAMNFPSGIARSTVTDTAGQYTFDNVQPGEQYRLTATLSGFQTTSVDVQAVPGATPRNVTMPIGALLETVIVSAEARAVDVQNARQQIAQVPQGGGLDRRGFGGGGGGGGSAANQGRVVVDGGVPGGVAGGVFGAPPPPAAIAPPPPTFRSAIDNVSRSDGAFSVPRPPTGTESYARVAENNFVRASQEPLATFSIDVDTASYSNVRRFLNMNQLPPADAVRIEELVNYFSYDYARPSGGHPIGASMEVTDAPWNSAHRLVRIGIKAREIDAKQRPPSNLVFLIDVSGSMNMPQKLPLVKSGLKMLVDQLGENDMVSIVVYAGTSGLVLPTTSGERKEVIAQAIDNLQAGGSTNGGAGIQLAYQQATNNFIKGGVNRVILVTDGDFNVGITSQGDLTRLIEDRARSGVFLSVLGFGMGNLKDSTMERLADMGNGHYAYIDTLNEARKVLVEEMSNTLVTVAKDVKIQVDFNPARVEAYRLIGYENRVLRPEDFNNDLKDAGEMGAGHAVTALFEIVPRGGSVPGPSIDPSVFQPAPRETPPPASASTSNDLLVLRVRYKQPDASDSTRMDVPLPDRRRAFKDASPDFRFAASVAGFGMILKNSQYRGDVTLPWVLDTATGSRGQDRGGYRAEFISLAQRAMSLGASLGASPGTALGR
jgi:Ca-activated chloride channel family protein